MASEEKQVSYQTTNTYSTLNQMGPRTKNVWFCCHGLGFLSRYFIRYFKALDKEENYIIAPQAPSKYYQNEDWKYVGASWLTKERTKPDMENILRYFDAVYEAEKLPVEKNLIVFGFSQGVSVSMRWMASRKIDCKGLVIYAGGIPKELKPEAFDYLAQTKVKLVYGLHDPYVNDDRIAEQTDFAKALFGDRLEVIPFEGKHEVEGDVIKHLF